MRKDVIAPLLLMRGSLRRSRDSVLLSWSSFIESPEVAVRFTPQSLIAAVLCVSSPALSVLAQKPPPQQVTVVVVNALPQPPQPVKAVSVSVMFQNVTAGRGVTNSQGQALLQVSTDTGQQGDPHLEILSAGDLVIFEPAGGELSGLTANIAIRLLPKGSPALLGPAQIQAMLHRESLAINGLQRQVAALKQSQAGTQQKAAALGSAIAEWAEANGFTSVQVDQEVQQWADGIEKQSGQATAEQKALAEMALSHYGAAAQLFTQAGDADRQALNAADAQEQALETQVRALQAAQQALLDKERSWLVQLLDHSQQAAGADQLDLKYHEATQSLENAVAIAQTEYKKHPDDKGFHELVLKAISNAATARGHEAEVAAAGQSVPLLAKCAADFQLLAGEYTGLGDRQGWADAQTNLGAALSREGERTTGDKMMGLFDEAIRAYQGALEVRTKSEFPREWAQTQQYLCSALSNQGERATGAKALALLDQAVAACRSALEVRTKADLPQYWAGTQDNLGIALWEEGRRATGDKAVTLFDQAVKAYQSAMEVQTRSAFPSQWSQAQNNLGLALRDEAGEQGDEKAMPLFEQSVEAFQNALQVRTKSATPQAWAQTESNLGSTLAFEGARTTGDTSSAYLARAVEAYQKALEVYTEGDLPQDWARTQGNLGNALREQGQSAGGAAAVALLDQAVQAYQRAMQVFTQANVPEAWAETESNIAISRRAEADDAGGEKKEDLLDQAVEAYNDALKVYTRADLPQDWASTQFNLGIAFRDEGESATGDKALALLDEAVQCDQNALGVFTKASTPQSWAQTQEDLGLGLMAEADRVPAEKSAALFDQAMQAYENAKGVLTEADDPEDWTEVRAYLIMADLGAGRFGSCIQQAHDMTGSSVTSYQGTVRDTLQFACEWAAGNMGAALATEKTLLTHPITHPGHLWGVASTTFFLSNSPAFAKGRSSWIALFTALQNSDSAGMTAALHQLEPFLRQ